MIMKPVLGGLLGVQGIGVRVQGLGLGAQGLGPRVPSLEFRV